MSERPPKPPSPDSRVTWVPFDESVLPPKSPHIPDTSTRVVWEKLDLDPETPKATSDSSPVKGWKPITPSPKIGDANQTPTHRGAPVDKLNPLGSRKEAHASDRIRVDMKPDELPAIVQFHDPVTNALVSKRGIKEDWHGAPVISFPTSSGDSVIIGPCLEPGYLHRPEICQDRASFSYGKDGALKAFAIADGVSQGIASASVADKLVQQTSALLAETTENIGDRALSKSEIDDILIRVQDALRAKVDASAMADDFLATTTMHKDFAKGFADDLRKGKSVGSATLIAGIVQSVKHPGTGEQGERITMVQIGDGGYVIVGPHPRREASVFGEFIQAGRAPAQIAPGKSQNVPSGSIHVQYVTLRPGEILLASTDGIEKGIWKTLQDFQHRAQELFTNGYADPNQLVRQLLWESDGGSGSWQDDTTIFAHQAH